MKRIKKKTIKETIKLIKKAIDNEITLNKVCIDDGKNRNYISNNVMYVRKVSPIEMTSDEIKLLGLYDAYAESKKTYTVKKDVSHSDVSYDASDDDAYDDRSLGKAIRDGEEFLLDDGQTVSKKISGYHYHVKIKNKPDLIGEFTREEMDLVYNLYSNVDGAGLTQRVVSRYFPKLSFVDFKRILRAFNITKSSHPVAPHIIEEASEDEVVDIIYRKKENNILKKLEEDRGKRSEMSLIESQKEILALKAKIKNWKEMVGNVVLQDIKPFYIEKQNIGKDNALVVYLSDMHIGAKTKENSLYNNDYDAEEFESRLASVCDEITRQWQSFGRFDKLIICNLGDSLDGYNGETTRGGHKLPQNLDNKEQFNVFVNTMMTFFETLHTLDVSNNIEYMCVGDANHDGDFGYIANRTIEIYLNTKFPDMNVKIFEKFMDKFEYGQHTFILSHGKDKEDRSRGFDLNLNDKLENFFNDYIYNHEINSKSIHVVSGDLHQSSANYGKRFRYKKVASLYGSSKWIHTNFGNTKAAVDFDIVPKNSGTILEGRLSLK